MPRRGYDSIAGLVELVRTPELYAWALVGILGTSTQQASFRAGALTASLPTMTVTEPGAISVNRTGWPRCSPRRVRCRTACACLADV